MPKFSCSNMAICFEKQVMLERWMDYKLQAEEVEATEIGLVTLLIEEQGDNRIEIISPESLDDTTKKKMWGHVRDKYDAATQICYSANPQKYYFYHQLWCEHQRELRACNKSMHQARALLLIIEPQKLPSFDQQ